MLRALSLALLLTISTGASALRIDVVPSDTQVSVGETFSIALVVSELTAASQVVSSFDVTLGLGALVTPLGVTFGSALGGPLDSLSGFDTAVAGFVSLFEVSLLDDASLEALQGDTVTLATIMLQAVATGISSIGFESVLLTGLIDPNDPTLPVTLDPSIGGTRVEIVPGVVPEPALPALVVVALLAWSVAARGSPRTSSSLR